MDPLTIAMILGGAGVQIGNWLMQSDALEKQSDIAESAAAESRQIGAQNRADTLAQQGITNAFQTQQANRNWQNTLWGRRWAQQQSAQSQKNWEKEFGMEGEKFQFTKEQYDYARKQQEKDKKRELIMNIAPTIQKGFLTDMNYRNWLVKNFAGAA